MFWEVFKSRIGFYIPDFISFFRSVGIAAYAALIMIHFRSPLFIVYIHLRFIPPKEGYNPENNENLHKNQLLEGNFQ